MNRIFVSAFFTTRLVAKIYRSIPANWRELIAVRREQTGRLLGGIGSQGVEGWLTGTRKELQGKRHKPQLARRVMIPKPGGGERPLGIPTIRDRVVQTAAKLVLDPIFEAYLEACVYGNRPKRSAQDAIGKTYKLIREGTRMS